MKLVVGLGNPGRKYQQTRHNVGFVAASKLAAAIGASQVKVKFEGELAEGIFQADKLCVLCPQTFMNASGRSVRKAVDFYKLSPDSVLVICDDMNLETGRLRLRACGSAGGQKGIADIIRHLETESFPRLRVGIGRPPGGWDAADYVLGKLTSDEQTEIDLATTLAADAALLWAARGIGEAMNRYNRDPTAPEPQRKKKSTTFRPDGPNDS